MVYYFYPRGFEPPDKYLIYLGRDKFENEDLIRYGLPHDVWFHVDDLSSAHGYIRLPQGVEWTDIPPDTLEDCAQLVKANSIQGCKMKSVDIIYTPWSNLRKTASMEVGQVGFKDNKMVRKVACERCNEHVNRLNRTKKEVANPDLAGERMAYDKEVSAQRKAEIVTQKREAKAAKEEAKRQEELKSYKNIMQEDNMTSAKDLGQKYTSAQDYEDDFM